MHNNGQSDPVSNHSRCIRWHFKHLQHYSMEIFAIITTLQLTKHCPRTPPAIVLIWKNNFVASTWWSVAPKRSFSIRLMDNRETGSGFTATLFDTVSQAWSRWLWRARREPRLLFITDQKTRCKYQWIRPSQPSKARKGTETCKPGWFFCYRIPKDIRSD